MMRKSNIQALFMALAIGVATVLTGCNGGSLTAQEAINIKHYAEAVKALEKEYPKASKERKLEIAEQLGEAYRYLDDYKKSEQWLTRAISLGSKKPKVLYGYAQVLKMMEKPDQAIEQLKLYQTMYADEGKNIDGQIAALEEYKKAKTDGCQLYDVSPFRVVNSDELDFSPVWGPDGLYFTSDRVGSTGKKKYGRTGGLYSDIYFLGRTKDKKNPKFLSEIELQPKSLEQVNTEKNQGTVSFTKKGNLMFYTDCNGPLNPETYAKDKKERPNCVIKVAKRVGQGWGSPEVLNICQDTVLMYGHPAISPDGTKLLMALDAPEGFGNHDIYLSTYNSKIKGWSDPVNLGPVVNTRGQEQFPTWFNDTTIYYSSDGIPGFGGLDIYMVHGRGNNWSTPERMKAPMNSPGDDFGITFAPDGESGFLTSNRIGSKKDDIYQFTIRPQSYYVYGTMYLVKDIRKPNDRTVFDKGAEIVFENQSARGEAGNQTFKVGADGKFKFKIDKGIKFNLLADAGQYQLANGILGIETHGNSLTWTCSRDTEIVIVVSPPITIEFPGVFYDLDDYKLRPESFKALDSLVTILKTFDYMVVELGSHTDCRAPIAYNDTLSQKRSNSCVEYLVQHGIAPERLVAKGYGERKLTNDCDCEPVKEGRREVQRGKGVNCTEAEHQANRRTTVALLRTDYHAPKVEEEEGEEEEVIEGIEE